MASNSDKQLEIIRQALRERESELADALFKDESEQDWQEDFTGSLEREVKYRNIQASRSGYMGEFFENILRAELAIMMDEYHSAMHFSHFLNTHSELILQAINRRLLASRVYIQHGKIRHYLKRLNHVFQAKIARGEEISAIPYLEKKTSKTSKANPPLSRKGRGKAEKNKVPKQGRKQPIMGFESIKEAAEKTGQNYNSLKSMKRRHELKNSI